MKTSNLTHLISFPLLLVVVLTLHTAIQAQNNYHPLLDETSIWNFERTVECEPYTPYYGFRYSLKLDGDTSIANINYQKLYRPAWEFFKPAWFGGTVEDCSSYFIPETGYIGALREDTAARTVFYLAANQDEEILLYDFSLEVGDTLNFYFPDFVFQEGGINIIGIVDSVMINGNYRKRWIVEEANSTEGAGEIVLIEGIGGLHGLIDPDPFFLMHAPNTELICYTNDSGDHYPLDAEECAVITNVHDTETHREIEVFPNPTSDNFSLLLPTSWVHQTTIIQVSDLTGRIVWESSSPTGTRIEIGTSGWKKGLYLLNIRNNHSHQSAKLIVH